MDTERNDEFHQTQRLSNTGLLAADPTLCQRGFYQWNTQSSNPTLWKRKPLDARTPNDTSPLQKNCPARKRHPFNRVTRDAKAHQGRWPTNTRHPPHKNCDSATPKRFPYTHKATGEMSALLTAALHPETALRQHSPKRSTSTTRFAKIRAPSVAHKTHDMS